MKLRIGTNNNFYWVEQRRWYGSWKLCHVYPGRDLFESGQRWPNIRFYETSRSKDHFESHEAALKYSEVWWLTFSFAAQKLRRIENMKRGNKISRLNYETFSTPFFRKQITIDNLKEKANGHF